MPVIRNHHSYSLLLFTRQYLLLFVSYYSLFDYLLHFHSSFVLIVVQKRKEQFWTWPCSGISIPLYEKYPVPVDYYLFNIGGLRHQPQYRRYPTSTSVTPISEENMSDWKLSFRYRKGSDIDIWVHSDIRYPTNIYHISRIRTQDTCFLSHCADLWIFRCRISDIR